MGPAQVGAGDRAAGSAGPQGRRERHPEDEAEQLDQGPGRRAPHRLAGHLEEPHRELAVGEALGSGAVRRPATTPRGRRRRPPARSGPRRRPARPRRGWPSATGGSSRVATTGVITVLEETVGMGVSWPTTVTSAGSRPTSSNASRSAASTTPSSPSSRPPGKATSPWWERSRSDRTVRTTRASPSSSNRGTSTAAGRASGGAGGRHGATAPARPDDPGVGQGGQHPMEGDAPAVGGREPGPGGGRTGAAVPGAGGSVSCRCPPGGLRVASEDSG